MQLIGREDELVKMNRKALEIARQVADETGTLMAGNLSNTTIYKPNDPEVEKEVMEMYKVSHICFHILFAQPQLQDWWVFKNSGHSQGPFEIIMYFSLGICLSLKLSKGTANDLWKNVKIPTFKSA